MGLFLGVSAVSTWELRYNEHLWDLTLRSEHLKGKKSCSHAKNSLKTKEIRSVKILQMWK